MSIRGKTRDLERYLLARDGNHMETVVVLWPTTGPGSSVNIPT